MKKILLILSAIAAISLSPEASAKETISLTGITPAAGSEITSFDFTLTFDLSAVEAAEGPGSYGIGWQSNHTVPPKSSERSVTIYRGDAVGGTPIGYACTSNYNPTVSGWTPSDKVEISLPGIAPEPGVTYTVKITNYFYAYEAGSGSTAKSDRLNFYLNPVTYSFVGSSEVAARPLLVSSSPASGAAVKSLDVLALNFNRAVTFAGGNEITVSDSKGVTAKSSDVTMSADGMTASVLFDGTPMVKGETYTVSIPAGAFVSTTDAAMTSDALTLTFSGDKYPTFDVASTTPANGETTLTRTVTVNFALPAGTRISADGATPPAGAQAYLYSGSVSPENLLSICAATGVTADGNGLTWEFPVSPEPGTDYIFVLHEGAFAPYSISAGAYSTEIFNPDVTLSFSTPTIADAGFPALTVGEGKTIDYDGNAVKVSPIASISTITLPVTGGAYSVGGVTEAISTEGNGNGYIYDITTATAPILIKEFNIAGIDIEGEASYLLEVYCQFNPNRKYRIEVPAGGMKIDNELLVNYAVSPEWAMEFEGNTTLTSPGKPYYCNLEGLTELATINAVIFKFKGYFLPSTSTNNPITVTQGIGHVESSVFAEQTITYEKDNTVLTAYCYDKKTGLPFNIPVGKNYTFGVSKYALQALPPYSSSSSVTEVSYTISGAAKNPAVTLIVNVNGMTTGVKADLYHPLTVNLAPDANWSVSALSFNGEDVLADLKNGNYETPALGGNSTLEATVEYTGQWSVENGTTGVWEIPGSDISIYGEDGEVVVTGVSSKNVISIYTVGATLVKRLTPESGTVRIPLDRGQLYIVTVDNTAARILL